MAEPAESTSVTDAPERVLERARTVAAEVLVPTAERVDRDGTLDGTPVPRTNLDALADAGLFGLAGPVDHDGLDLDPHTARRVLATIGGACGATFFVWVQHHGVVRTLAGAGGPLATAHLGPLCRGEELAGTAFAHVRRTGSPAITARRTEGGWVLDGHAPWATSWGLADHHAVAAVDGDDLVWALVPGDGPTGVRAEVLELPVFAATSTVTLDFDACLVSDDAVIAVEPLDAWRAADARRASLGQPAVLGVAERAVTLLGGIRGGDDRDARGAAERLGLDLADRWRGDDELVDALLTGDDVIGPASDHRARCLDLARRATTALLAAVGGRGMALDHPAQRLAREAVFYVIQAQTAAGRAATLRQT